MTIIYSTAVIKSIDPGEMFRLAHVCIYSTRREIHKGLLELPLLAVRVSSTGGQGGKLPPKLTSFPP